MGYIEQFWESVTKVIKVGQENVTVKTRISMVLFSGGWLGKNPFRRPFIWLKAWSRAKNAFNIIISHFFFFLSSVVVSHDRAVGAGGKAGGALPPPNFGRSVNPVWTRGANYARHITTCPPPGFSDLPMALWHGSGLFRLRSPLPKS